MVDKFILFFIMSFLVVGCSQPSDKLNGSVAEMNNMSNDEKDAFDKQYLNDLKDIDISEKDFIYISRYIIELAKKNNFPEVDPILGKKERMYSKDFKDPYISYHYVHIPYYPSIEVYLKYRKDDNKLVMISLNRAGTAGGLSFKEYKLNTLEQLNLQVIKKELSADSNQIYKYQLSDENFRYEVYGKDNIDNQPPKEFYDFRILTSGI